MQIMNEGFLQEMVPTPAWLPGPHAALWGDEGVVALVCAPGEARQLCEHTCR